MPTKGRPTKEFQEYLTSHNSSSHVGHSDYLKSPATAFLKFLVEAKNAIDLCNRNLLTNKDGNHSKNTTDTLQHLQIALLPALMGHFETFQRYLFAGIFDHSIYLSNFAPDEFFAKLKKECSVNIDPVRLSAYRGIGASSIGTLLADSLTGWHNPGKVNKLFDCFCLEYRFWSSDACKKLGVLWQLRHSIVHTGGTLTLPDSQKISELHAHGDKQIVFEDNFIFEVSRKLHPIVQTATEGIGNKFKSKLTPNLDAEARKKIDTFFEVKSSVSVWLRKD